MRPGRIVRERGVLQQIVIPQEGASMRPGRIVRERLLFGVVLAAPSALQ
jgi:hypothetical protein